MYLLYGPPSKRYNYIWVVDPPDGGSIIFLPRITIVNIIETMT